MSEIFVSGLRTLNELLSAGIAITAFSLLLYALSFNLRDRVARSFAAILVCVVLVFVAEALSSVAQNHTQLEFWLRFQWLGIVFLPPSYLHLSDALLATTGRPSRGRRRLVVRMMYLVSLAFLATLPTSWLVGDLIADAQPAPHLQRTPVTWVFTFFYIACMTVAWVNFWRAYQRTAARASRRRFTYLLTGALAPALGSFPFLLFGFSFAAQHPLIFWATVTLSNLAVSVLLIVMAYAVAFFGVPWPDRVVKRRLAKWLMRGPVTASTVLAITTVVRRTGGWIGIDPAALTPIVMVASILILEHLISLAAPIWERWFFLGKDRADMELIQTLDERLLTLSDLQQFLEAILAAISDRMQATSAFVAALNPQGIDTLVTIGGDQKLEQENLSENLLQAVVTQKEQTASMPHGLFSWGDYWLAPIYDPETSNVNGNSNLALLGLLGVTRQADQTIDQEQSEALAILTGRVAMALSDRRRQQQAFSSLEALTPKMSMLQRMRAAARYDSTEILSLDDLTLKDEGFSSWVKDALTDYWGGPKLTQNPLLSLQVVQQIMQTEEENPTNALRVILRKAIENVRPTGERRFTAEWILYNILEMRFMEGRKIREIALRLAMSEADLYRKQRVAIEAVARVIIDMEKKARDQNGSSTAQKDSLPAPESAPDDMGSAPILQTSTKNK